MGFLFETGCAAEVARVCEAPRKWDGARDRVGRFRGGVGCEVDTGWEGTVAAGRRRRAGNVGSESHGVAALQHFADAEQYRREGGNLLHGGQVQVKIEWDGLDQRIRQLTHLGGSVTDVVPAPDSRSYAVVVGGGAEEGPGLYVIGDDGTRLTRISAAAEGGGGGGRGRGGAGGGGGFDPQWSKDGRSVYYMQGGGIYSAAAPAVPAGDTVVATGGGGGRAGRGGGAAPAAGAANTAPRRIAFT